MKPRQQVTRAAIELIERFEGYRRSAAQLENGRWTIGYGHTKTARQSAEVSKADAEALLLYDLMEIAGALNEWVYTPLTQNQFDALAAFVFNIGLDNFKHSSVLRRLNEGALLQAACAMEMWRKADLDGERIVVDALVRRRAAEKTLFLTPPHGFIPAPTPIIRPAVDHDITGHVPAQRPVEVKAALEGERAVAERVGAVAALRPVEDVEAEGPSASQVAADEITARLQSLLSEAEDASEEPEAAAPSFPADGGSAELELPAPPAEPLEAPAEASEPETAAIAEASASGAFSLTAPSEVEPIEPDPLAGLAPPVVETVGPAEPQLFEPAPEPEPMVFAPAPDHRFDDVPDFGEVPVESTGVLGAVPRFIGLMLVGLVVFAGALFWAFNTRHQGEGLFTPQIMVALGLGFAGIGCVAIAVYFLLERLGGREEP